MASSRPAFRGSLSPPFASLRLTFPSRLSVELFLLYVVDLTLLPTIATHLVPASLRVWHLGLKSSSSLNGGFCEDGCAHTSLSVWHLLGAESISEDGCFPQARSPHLYLLYLYY